MKELFESGTIIPAENTWALWGALAVIVAISVWLSERYKWASKMSAPVIAIAIGVILANIHVLPVASDVYNTSAIYCIPMATAMMLYQANVKTIIKNSGKMFICMNIGIAATFVGGIISFIILNNSLDEAVPLTGAAIGSFIGGTANLIAVGSSTGLSDTMLSAASFAANFVMTIAIVILLWMPSSDFFKKHYNHPHQEELENNTNVDADINASIIGKFKKGNDISLLDIAKVCGIAFLIVALSDKVSGLISTLLATDAAVGTAAQIPAMVLGNRYVVMTIITMILVAVFPKFFEGLKGGNEIGSFVMYLYFAVIGCTIDLSALAANIIPVIIMFIIIGAFNIILPLIIGKFTKLNIEEMTISSNACIGGPFTAMAMASSKGYTKLVVPALLCGIWGNVLGNILGVTLVGILKIL